MPLDNPFGAGWPLRDRHPLSAFVTGLGLAYRDPGRSLAPRPFRLAWASGLPGVDLALPADAPDPADPTPTVGGRKNGPAVENDRDHLIAESADLLFHLLVLLKARGVKSPNRADAWLLTFHEGGFPRVGRSAPIKYRTLGMRRHA